MKNQEIIRMLMRSQLYLSLPLFQRLQMTRFVRDCGFDSDEIDDIFLKSFGQDWYEPHISCDN